MLKQSHYDIVIVGGGHNGLVAAAYLAKAGYSVLILERRDHVGGAAVSEQIFPGMDARLSAYAYLVSLFPQKISDDLGLRFTTRRRATASFTPTIRNGQHRALLGSNDSPQLTEESFVALTGNRTEYNAFQQFYNLTAEFAAQVWPTLLEPLVTRDDLKQRFTTPQLRKVWDMLIEHPLGESIERTFNDDLVRGVVLTDAKIGVLTHAHDPSLLQNRTFLYHIVGNATGEWRVPVGGMGAVTGELERVARQAGTTIITSASVQQIGVQQTAEIEFIVGEKSHRVSASYVLVNATPTELARFTDNPHPPQKPNGSVFKINMLLKRLPKLKSGGYLPEQAFAGTFHIDEGYTAMQESYITAASGTMPEQPPGEMYCHSLTDSSILGSNLQGYHTLTLFGLDMPYSLFTNNPEAAKQEALKRYIAGINRYLDEPIEDCFAIDQNGKPCVDAKSPLDLERELNMHGGNIFHTDLTWPFVEQEALRGTWGVETDSPNIFLCGSGAARGGCVSGIPGHNAAMKVLECLKKPS